jgi:hypothetical protein
LVGCNYREAGSVVREAIKRGEQAIEEEAKANDAVQKNAKIKKRWLEVIFSGHLFYIKSVIIYLFTINSIL